ncbi:MAG: nitroreductase [Xanthobacteraceae bacterium]|nr:nitroreductase [Xanthobacteraceae bacterium]
MPDALELLKNRRSLKPIEMTGPGPSAAELDTILTIGSRVPDHGKLSPWRFIVFEGDGRERAGEIFARIFRAKNVTATPDQVDVERKRFTHAPVVIAVVSKLVEHVKVPAWEQELSAGASAMNVINAAHALGYVSDWVTGWLAFDRDVMDALGLASSERIAGFIHIGKATRTIEDRPRPPLSDIVTRF